MYGRFEFSIPDDAPPDSRIIFSVTNFRCQVCGSRELVLTIEPDHDNKRISLTYDCPEGHVTRGMMYGRA